MPELHEKYDKHEATSEAKENPKYLNKITSKHVAHDMEIYMTT